MSPMAMYSARTGHPTTSISSISAAGRSAAPALCFSEMTCVSPDARITPGCLRSVERRTGGGLEATSSNSSMGRRRQNSASSSAMPDARVRRAWPGGIDQPLDAAKVKRNGSARLQDDVVIPRYPVGPGLRLGVIIIRFAEDADDREFLCEPGGRLLLLLVGIAPKDLDQHIPFIALHGQKANQEEQSLKELARARPSPCCPVRAGTAQWLRPSRWALGHCRATRAGTSGRSFRQPLRHW